MSSVPLVWCQTSPYGGLISIEMSSRGSLVCVPLSSSRNVGMASVALVLRAQAFELANDMALHALCTLGCDRIEHGEALGCLRELLLDRPRGSIVRDTAIELRPLEASHRDHVLDAA